MCQDPGLTPEQQRMEAIMGQLRPSARSLDHEMLIFEAGRASQGSKRPWQAMCGVLTMLLCGSLIVHIPPTETTTSVTVAQQNPAPAPLVHMQQSDHSPDYLDLQKDVLSRGLDALPRYRTVRTVHRKQLDQKTLLQNLLLSDKMHSGLL